MLEGDKEPVGVTWETKVGRRSEATTALLEPSLGNCSSRTFLRTRFAALIPKLATLPLRPLRSSPLLAFTPPLIPKSRNLPSPPSLRRARCTPSQCMAGRLLSRTSPLSMVDPLETCLTSWRTERYSTDRRQAALADTYSRYRRLLGGRGREF